MEITTKVNEKLFHRADSVLLFTVNVIYLSCKQYDRWLKIQNCG